MLVDVQLMTDVETCDELLKVMIKNDQLSHDKFVDLNNHFPLPEYESPIAL